jgi:hypothetical protein
MHSVSCEEERKLVIRWGASSLSELHFPYLTKAAAEGSNEVFQLLEEEYSAPSVSLGLR